MDDSAASSARVHRAVPLFPLPNVVLFPRAVLPLHIFEERYKTMTADALAGKRQIAMALLRPGWEKSYYGRPPIEPVVCIGTILSHERLEDGKYNFLLQGHARARIVSEPKADDRPYRVADLEALAEITVSESELLPQRDKFVAHFTKGALATSGLGIQLLKLLSSPLPTAEITDIVAFNFFDDAVLKQALLAEVNVKARIEQTLAELESLALRVRTAAAAASIGAPPVISKLHPPSLN
jgi:uncharacterized protein